MGLGWALACGMACQASDEFGSTSGGPGTASGDGDASTSGSGDTGAGTGTATKGGGDDGTGGGAGGCEEVIPPHKACDAGTSDVFNAMGLNCPGELHVMTDAMGNPIQAGVRTSFGMGGLFSPREGDSYAVIGTGDINDVGMPTPDLDAGLGHAFPTFCSKMLGLQGGGMPSDPIKIGGVGDPGCDMDPSLIGTGDCSNTLEGQFDQGGGAFDYVELRLTLKVPEGVTSFSYDFAFMTTEYPAYYKARFNDMYIGWLESESWTGNISFDDMGNPISLNAGFLNFRDDTGTEPELAGTCMRFHAGTRWLRTTAPVTPGETIIVVFAIFDLSDGILDSYVLLDNFQWGCTPVPNKPMTVVE